MFGRIAVFIAAAGGSLVAGCGGGGVATVVSTVTSPPAAPAPAPEKINYNLDVSLADDQGRFVAGGLFYKSVLNMQLTATRCGSSPNQMTLVIANQRRSATMCGGARRRASFRVPLAVLYGGRNALLVDEPGYMFATVSLSPRRHTRPLSWKLYADDQRQASGLIVARGYAWRPATTRRIWQYEQDDFINICINGLHQLRSEGGNLYCEIEGETASGRVRLTFVSRGNRP